MKGKTLTIIAGVASLVLLSFGAYAGMGIYMLTQICTSIIKYELKGIDGRYIYLNLIMQVYNPSKLSVGIEGYKLNILLNGTLVSSLKSNTIKNIEGEKINTLNLPVKIDYVSAFGKTTSQEIIGYFLTKKFDKIVIGVKGDFKARLLKVPVSKDIDIKMSLLEIQEVMNQPPTPCPTA